MGSMKTTLDLPSDLVREIKVKAVLEGRKLKDAVAELLRRGLAAASANPGKGGERRKRARLPIVRCRHAARPATEMTPERVAAVLLEQECAWSDEAGR